MESNYRPPLPFYRDLHYVYRDRYIESLEEQVYLYKKQQYNHDTTVGRLYRRIEQLEERLSDISCYKCHTDQDDNSKLVCQDCSDRKHPRIDRERKGPACDGCRMRKRKCDRKKPFCSYCVKIHKNRPGQPNCTYTKEAALQSPLSFDSQPSEDSFNM